MTSLSLLSEFYDWMSSNEDPRVKEWPLMTSPVPVISIVMFYLVTLKLGPELMQGRKVMELQMFKIIYNLGLVILSTYMFYELLVTSILADYSYICQPVDYSTDPLAMRMASVCWWYFFFKIIELIDTILLIIGKRPVSFLHAYHHSTMSFCWWLGAKYVPGGQSWFQAMINTFVHVVMYSYYGLSALGPTVRKYLWWKKYLTMLQLGQFFVVMVHTGINMAQADCDFPQGYNYISFLYAISLIVLFANFFQKAYIKKGQ